MALSLEELSKLYGATTTGTPVKPVSSGMPVSFDIRTYQQPSTANAGSTTQQYQTTQQKIQSATSGIIGGQNQTRLPQTGQQIVQQATTGIQGGQNQTPAPYNPYQGMSFGDNASSSQAQGGYTYVPPPLSKEQSAGTAKSYGLQGIADGKFTGMTQSQANQAAQEMQNKLKQQVSAGTSYSFNPQAISGFNDKTKQLKTKVDEINNSTWESPGSKKTNVDSTIKSFTNQLAGGFNTVEEFQNAINTNPEFDKSVAEYQRMGGDVNNIMGAIQQKQQAKNVSVTSYRDNPDGTTTNFYSDGTQSTGKLSKNADGTYSFNELDNGIQTLDQYLGRVSTPAEKQAYNSLIPEQKSLQAQIAFEQGIVDKYKDYYFGSEEKIGLLQQQRQQAKERASLLETQAKLAADNAKAQSDLLIQQQDAQVAEQEAEIEENSLVAKNYMTGMLAKLGALNTTGAAAEGLVKIQAKYDKMKQSARTNYNNNKLAITFKMNETLSDLEMKKQDAILTLKENLSKSETDIVKEVFKLETDATRKSFDAVDKYLGMYRTQKDKYIKEAKTLAEKNAKLAAAAMSSYNLSSFTFDNFLKSKSTGGEQTTIGGNSPIGGMQVTTGGQSYDPNQTQSMYPQYLQAIIKSGVVSPETQSVLKGEKSIVDLTNAESKIAKAELAKLKINPNTIQSTKAPEVGVLLKEAQSLINNGEDRQTVKQLFLESYPEKSATFEAYIKK